MCCHDVKAINLAADRLKAFAPGLMTVVKTPALHASVRYSA